MKRFLPFALALAACGNRGGVAPPPTSGANDPPRVSPGSLEIRPLLGDLPARASHLGAGPVAVISAGPITEGERVGAFVDIPKNVCLLFYARSSASLEDIDLAAFAEEGSPVAGDETRDAKPTLLLCPPHPDRVYVAVRAAAGDGLCVVAAQLVPRDRAEAVGRAVGAHGSSPRTPETWPGLDDQVKAHRAALGGTWEEVRRVAIAIDFRAPSPVAFDIDETGCTDAFVVPDDDVSAVDVDVLDADGRLVARAKETGGTRSVTVCSQTAIKGSLQLRPHSGSGLVAVVLARASAEGARDVANKPDVAWIAPNRTIDAAKTAREQLLGKAGYSAAASTAGGQLQLGRRVTQTIDLGAGPCARVDVVGGAPLALVDAAIWDDGGSLLASGDGIDSTSLFACGKGRVRLDLGTRGRPGPYAALVRPEKWKDPTFAAHPLAASRMLSRAASVAGVHEGKAGAVHTTVLEPAKRYMQDANIAPNTCLAVAAGVSGEGTGLELRLFDAVSGDELDRSHGQFAAGVRACAGKSAARSIRVEARATAGKLDAVLGERVIPASP